ncbi:hypothetical protein Tco_0465443 [Tanacetum coccineum]
METQIEQFTKEYHTKPANEVPNSSIGQCKVVFANKDSQIDETSSNRTNETQRVSFVTDDDIQVAEEKDDVPSGVLPCQLPPKELRNLSEMMILGRPFLATIHAQINVFHGEISLGIEEDWIIFDMNGKVHHSKTPIQKVYMANSIQEEESFNLLEIGDDLFSYESPVCLRFEQYTQLCNNENVDTLGSFDKLQEPEVERKDVDAGPITSRWHLCKPVRVFYNNECRKDYGMWPTCDPNLSLCNGGYTVYRKGEHMMLEQWMCFRDNKRRSVKGNYMEFVDFLQVRYGNHKINDTTQERRYYEWVAQNCKFHDEGTSQRTTMPNNLGSYHHEYPTSSYFPNFTQKDREVPILWDSSFKGKCFENHIPLDCGSTSAPKQALTPRGLPNHFIRKI